MESDDIERTHEYFMLFILKGETKGSRQNVAVSNLIRLVAF